MGLVVEFQCENPNCKKIFVGRKKYCCTECYLENKKLMNNNGYSRERSRKYENKIKNQTILEKELLKSFGINIENGMIREEVKRSDAIEIIEVSC